MSRLGGGVGARWTGSTALVLALLALTGCETTAEKSAKLRRQAKRVTLSQKGLSISRESADVKVVSATVVRSSEGAAAVVRLANRSSRTLGGVPIAITVTDSRGRTLFQNDGAGLEAALVSVPSIGPHRAFVWVDDQLPVNGDPVSVRARVGEAPAVAGAVPQLAIGATRLGEDPTNGPEASGTVSNRSSIAQRNLVIFAVALRGGKPVAAGRAIVPALAARASTQFEVFFVGDPRGAHLQISAPPTTFG